MTQYTYRFSELWRENTSILDTELEQLKDYLHNTNIDTDFDPEQHVYVHESGDRWIFLPELTENQLFAIALILSSSELCQDDVPVRFAQPPGPAVDLAHTE